MEQDDDVLSPVCGMTTAVISEYGYVMLRLDYLTHPMQALDQAHSSPKFVFQAALASELVSQIERALARLKSGPPPGTGLPKH